MAHALPVSLRVLGALAFTALTATGVSACGSDVGMDDESLGETAQALETFPNEQPAFDYFRLKGLSAEQSAGIVGNLDVESGCNPAAVQKGGPGRGIAQWSAGARWDTLPDDNVVDFAADQGKSATSLQVQLDFIWYELTSFPAYGLTKLKATTTLAGAVQAFATYYEGCGSCSTSKRIAYGESVLTRFAGIAPTPGSSSGSEPETPCTLDSGDKGDCITVAACAARGAHVSTAGFCPGAADIQCCTAIAGSGSSGASGGSSSSSSTSSSGGELSKPAARDDDGTGGCSVGARTAGAPGASAWGLVLAVCALVSLRRAGRSSSDRR